MKKLIPLFLFLSGCAAIAAVTTTPAPAVTMPAPATMVANPFGLYTSWSQGQNVASDIKVFDVLETGAHYIRIPEECLRADDSLAKAVGLQVVMGVTQASIETDINIYRAAIVSVENEENNPGMYAGTFAQYSQELAASVTLVHAAGMKACNGGITQVPALLCAWVDLYLRNPDSARSIAKNFPEASAEISYPAVLKNPEYVKGLSFIGLYKNTPIDYVNFHYYCSSPADAAGMAMVIDYLRRATGRPVITNEIGQRDTSAATVTAMLQVVKAKKLPVAIWFNTDGKNHEYALANIDGALRSTGMAFRNFIQAY